MGWKTKAIYRIRVVAERSTMLVEIFIVVGCVIAVIAHQEYRYQCLSRRSIPVGNGIDAVGEMIGDQPRKEE